MATSTVKRQYILLKPMASGVNGFARLETQRDYILLQLTCKDLKPHAKALRVFLYAGEGAVQELARAQVNAQGQATVTADVPQREWAMSPSRLQALLILSDDPEPKPLMLGLCAQQSSGSLLDAKNAMLALCSKLSVRVLEPADPPRPARASLPSGAAALPSAANPEAYHAPPPSPQTGTRLLPGRRALPSSVPRDPTPQEVFLSAIDPTVYIAAEGESSRLASSGPVRLSEDTSTASLPTRFGTEAEPDEPEPPVSNRRWTDGALPVDRLRPLEWPTKWRELAPHFQNRMPVAPFNAPGWRFVRVPMTRGGSFVVGMRWQDNRVQRIAYAVPGIRNQPPPKELARYRWQQGRDGQGYWVLWQEAK